MEISKNKLPNIKKAKKRNIKKKIITFCYDKKFNNLGKNKKYFIRTYGCQSNIRDSEIISGILKQLSYVPTTNIENANLVILNTCAIRENAELKVFSEIGLLKKLKEKNDVKFGICGCMAQEEGVVEKIIKKIPHVDFIFGTNDINEIPRILYDLYNTKKRVISVSSNLNYIYENLPSIRDNKIKAFVNIMYGCDKFCSYCIVPYTRGPLRSRKSEDILQEVNELIKKGYKEVTLIGQNVNSYGLDFKKNYYFKNLLEDVAKTNIERVRFTTSNPWNFTKDIVDVMSKYKNIMPHIHLPIQSGDEAILEAMNRKMKIEKYLELISYIKEKIPNCSITTDIIVGFPNESSKQFSNTIKLYDTVKFDNAYTFIFSKRIGTPAALIKDKILDETKKQRLEMLNEIVRKYAKENCEKWVGKIIDVLVEGSSKKEKKVLTGYSPQWKVVNFIGKAKEGQIVKVKITSASRFSLNGNQI